MGVNGRDKMVCFYTNLTQASRAATSTNVDISDRLTGIPKLQTLGIDLRGTYRTRYPREACGSSIASTSSNEGSSDGVM